VPAKYTPGDFRECAEWATSNSFFANAGDGGVTVEFPWDEGAVSHFAATLGYGKDVPGDVPDEERRRQMALGGSTLLLTLDTGPKHPLLGSGMLCLLRLPVTLDGVEAMQAAEALNRWELNHADMVPTVGAWAPDTTTSGLAFTCFIPGAFAFDFLPRHLTWWMAGRGWRARRWLLDAGLATAKRLVDV
jgi:hypothetical protein